MLATTICEVPKLNGRPVRKACAAIAVVNYFDVPYEEAVELLQAHTDFHPNGGVTTRQFRRMLEDMGMRYVPARVRLTARDPLAKLPQNAILQFGRHVATLKEGVIYDSFHTTLHTGTKQTVGYYVEV